MKERPILFNTAMVQAILAGRKTQTRRQVKPELVQPEPGAYFDSYNKTEQWNWWLKDNRMFLSQIVTCPFGKVGDRLWVRETWCKGRIDEIDAEHPLDRSLYIEQTSTDDGLLYKADCLNDGIDISEAVWRPSIHMPRSVCRIILEITSVRVERLHNISDADCKAEGIVPYKDGWTNGIIGPFSTPQLAFCDLWDETGGKSVTNPWVWVVEFKVLTTNGKVPEGAA